MNDTLTFTHTKNVQTRDAQLAIAIDKTYLSRQIYAITGKTDKIEDKKIMDGIKYLNIEGNPFCLRLLYLIDF